MNLYIRGMEMLDVPRRKLMEDQRQQQPAEIIHGALTCCSNATWTHTKNEMRSKWRFKGEAEHTVVLDTIQASARS